MPRYNELRDPVAGGKRNSVNPYVSVNSHLNLLLSAYIALAQGHVNG